MVEMLLSCYIPHLSKMSIIHMAAIIPNQAVVSRLTLQDDT